MVSDLDIFLHNLAVDLALETMEACRLPGLTLSDEVVNHLSDAFNQALKHVRDARKSSH